MMIIIRKVELYQPEYAGIKDVLIVAGKIVRIEPEIEIPGSWDVKEINGEGLKAVPGFIDAHVHIAGAGGEGGPSTRTPEMQLSMMLEAGVTTVIGCLGTDGITRSVESVLMKTKSLRAEGVSAWMYTGAYQYPTPTILGEVARDIAMIDEIIGVGEIAISDHRSSVPDTKELIRLTEHARVGGMLGGKAGIVNIHMGDAKNPFKPIEEAVEKSELGFKQFFPTHINRNDYIFEDAKEYGKKGWVDITTSSYPYFPQYEIKPSKAIAELLKAGVPIEHITLTSDACGSLPDFDKDGNLVRLESGTLKANLVELADAVTQEKLPLETVLKCLTSNPAKILKLHQKGQLKVGLDADIVLLDNNFAIKHLFANGRHMTDNYKILKKGTYEK